MNSTIFSVIRNTFFKVSSIIVVSTYVAILLAMQWSSFRVNETMPQIFEVSEKTKKITSVVKTGMYITNFAQFSFNQNEFLLDAFVWFRFPEGTEVLKTLGKFSIYFSLLQENGLMQYSSEPIIKHIGNDILATYHIQTEFKAHLNFKEFPMEDHKLNILLQNKSVTPNELCFESGSENFSINKQALEAYYYSPKYTTVKTGYIRAPLASNDPKMEMTYPCVLYSVDFESRGMRDLVSLYFPMIVIFLIGLLSMLIEITDITRLNLIAASVPTLVLFRLVIDGAAPKVGYSMHVDNVFYLLMSLSLLLLLFQSSIALTLSKLKKENATKHAKAEELFLKLNDILFIAILSAFAIFMTFICL